MGAKAGSISLYPALHDKLRDISILDAGHKMEGSGKHAA